MDLSATPSQSVSTQFMQSAPKVMVSDSPVISVTSIRSASDAQTARWGG